MEQNAASDEIREAYLVLVKVWHPDRFQEDEHLKRQAGDKLAAINSAYQYLLKNQTPRPKAPSASASGFVYPSAATRGAQGSYGGNPAVPQHTRGRGPIDIVTVAGTIFVLLLAAGAYIAKRPNKSTLAKIVDGPAYLSSVKRSTPPVADKSSSHKDDDTATDHELHLVANLFGGGATSDGRTYSVALIAAYQGKIPPRTTLFVQGVIMGQVGPQFIAIRDEQVQQKTLLCRMTAEEFGDSSFIFQTGDRVQAYGTYTLTASGVPALLDCRLASPTDKVVRPDGEQTQPTSQAAVPVNPPQPAQPETDATNSFPADTVVRRIGGSVSPPVVLFAPEPEFSAEARKQKVAGNVLVYLQVGPDGLPSHVQVLRGIGMGLDEKAVEAVNKYRFRPAMENGRPVTVEMNVEVNFQIF